MMKSGQARSKTVHRTTGGSPGHRISDLLCIGLYATLDANDELNICSHPGPERELQAQADRRRGRGGCAGACSNPWTPGLTSMPRPVRVRTKVAVNPNKRATRATGKAVRKRSYLRKRADPRQRQEQPPTPLPETDGRARRLRGDAQVAHSSSDDKARGHEKNPAPRVAHVCQQRGILDQKPAGFRTGIQSESGPHRAAQAEGRPQTPWPVAPSCVLVEHTEGYNNPSQSQRGQVNGHAPVAREGESV